MPSPIEAAKVNPSSILKYNTQASFPGHLPEWIFTTILERKSETPKSIKATNA